MRVSAGRANPVWAGLTALFVLVPGVGFCQEPQLLRGPPETPAEFFQRTKEIGDVLRAFVDTSAVPGVSIALGVGQDFTWFEGFGYADVEGGTPMTPDTRVRIGSVSKALTATALGLLVEDGTLKLDVEVQDYVPEFPKKEFPITLRHLASHQSGIRHYRGDEALSNRRFETVSEAVAVFAPDPLVTEPGVATSYSTYGYTLLSAAMERASGQPFLDLMEERVLSPLGMARTGPENKGHLHPDQAVGYEPGSSGPPRRPPETDLSNKWAGGGYVSTAGDLLRFARAHLDGTLLAPETLDLLWSPQVTRDGEETPFGIGWQVAQMPDGTRLLVAGGNAMGGTTVVFVFPEDGVVVVFLTNIGNAPIRGVPLRLGRILLGAETPTPATPEGAR